MSSIPVDAEEIFSDRDRFVDVDELENHKDSENNLSEMVYDSSGFELQNVPVLAPHTVLDLMGEKDNSTRRENSIAISIYLAHRNLGL